MALNLCRAARRIGRTDVDVPRRLRGCGRGRRVHRQHGGRRDGLVRTPSGCVYGVGATGQCGPGGRAQSRGPDRQSDARLFYRRRLCAGPRLAGKWRMPSQIRTSPGPRAPTLAIKRGLCLASCKRSMKTVMIGCAVRSRSTLSTRTRPAIGETSFLKTADLMRSFRPPA